MFNFVDFRVIPNQQNTELFPGITVNEKHVKCIYRRLARS